jgi:hypothetical protein
LWPFLSAAAGVRRLLYLLRVTVMSDGREEREEREKRLEQEERENREDHIDREPADQWEPERVDS